MIDTIGLNITGYRLNEGCLNNIKDFIDRETGEIILRANLGNLRIKQSADNISIFGSLPKFYFGNNINQLTRKDIERAIEKLSDYMKIPIQESNVFRIDVGANFLMKYPVKSYYQELGNLSRFKKSDFSNNQTLLYSTSSISIEFYDKLKETKRKREAIDEIFIGKNLLRYEAQFKKVISVKKRLKLSELKAKHLFNEKNYVEIIEYWKDLYFAIDRISKSNITKINSMKPKELKKTLAKIGLIQVGSDYLLAELEARKSELSKMDYSRAKRLIRELERESEPVKNESKIKELDEKVLRIVKYYR